MVAPVNAFGELLGALWVVLGTPRDLGCPQGALEGARPETTVGPTPKATPGVRDLVPEPRPASRETGTGDKKSISFFMRGTICLFSTRAIDR